MKHSQYILDEYDNQQRLYSDFNIKSRQLIIELLLNSNLTYHQITDRIKDKDKLETKLIKKGHKYKSLCEITDVCGIRIITYFEDEVDKIAEIIKKEFVIDEKNSIDKRQLETDRFGYRSLHYVVSLEKNRTELTEYKKFKGLKLEIQIRTILQHSWAEIEHDIGYKGEVAIPEFAKRTFYRLAALLETADLEFVSLKNSLRDYEKQVKVDIIESPESVLLNQASLSSYISDSQIIKDLDKKFAGFLKVPVEGDPGDSAKLLLEKLLSNGITTIKELDEIIQNNNEELFDIYKSCSDDEGDLNSVFAVVRGVAIFQVETFLQMKK